LDDPGGLFGLFGFFVFDDFYDRQREYEQARPDDYGETEEPEQLGMNAIKPRLSPLTTSEIRAGWLEQMDAALAKVAQFGATAPAQPSSGHVAKLITRSKTRSIPNGEARPPASTWSWGAWFRARFATPSKGVLR